MEARGKKTGREKKKANQKKKTGREVHHKAEKKERKIKKK